jgi:two-component system, NarL family, response regulator LiaR
MRPVGDASRTRILLVDDEELFVQAAREILAADPRIEVVGVARDGDEAVELAERLQPDLVLMDIGLPRVDGVTATAEIGRCCPRARVVMLTARGGREDADASDSAGAIGYITKDELGSPHLADSLLALLELS